MSGITITADSGTQFEGSAIQYTSVARLDDDNFVVAFADNGDGNKGKVNVGSKSGTTVTISELNVVTFNTDTTSKITIYALSSSSFVISYYDVNSARPYIIVGTISGTTITLGTAVKIYDVACNGVSVAVLDSTHCVASVSRTSNGYIYFYLGTISGTVVNLGTKNEYSAANARYDIKTIGLNSSNFFICSVENYGYGGYGTAAMVVYMDTGSGLIAAGGSYGYYGYPLSSDSLYLDKFSSQHVLIGARTQSLYTDISLYSLSINISARTISAGTPIKTSTSATDQTYHSICCLNNLNFVCSYYTTTGTQGEVRSGTCSDGATTIAWDAQGPVAFDNTELSHTALCRLSDTYFLLGFNHV